MINDCFCKIFLSKLHLNKKPAIGLRKVCWRNDIKREGNICVGELIQRKRCTKTTYDKKSEH